MPVRLLHTADWQLGRSFAGIGGDAAALLREARFEAVRKIAGLATQHEVDAVLVAGDAFDGNQVAEATIHPVIMGPSAGNPSTSIGMTKPMVAAMVFCFITFTFVYATLLWHRIRLQNLADRVNHLKSLVLGKEAA